MVALALCLQYNACQKRGRRNEKILRPFPSVGSLFIFYKKLSLRVQPLPKSFFSAVKLLASSPQNFSDLSATQK